MQDIINDNRRPYLIRLAPDIILPQTAPSLMATGHRSNCPALTLNVIAVAAASTTLLLLQRRKRNHVPIPDLPDAPRRNGTRYATALRPRLGDTTAQRSLQRSDGDVNSIISIILSVLRRG